MTQDLRYAPPSNRAVATTPTGSPLDDHRQLQFAGIWLMTIEVIFQSTIVIRCTAD